MAGRFNAIDRNSYINVKRTECDVLSEKLM
jgi:hypothetical protein